MKGEKVKGEKTVTLSGYLTSTYGGFSVEWSEAELVTSVVQ